MVTVVVPDPVTWLLVTGMASTGPVSVWWMVMVPVATYMSSLKVRVMLVSTATAVASSAGVVATSSGGVVSDVVKSSDGGGLSGFG